MPAFKRRFRKRRTGRKLRRNKRVARSLMFNPRPVFTESYRLMAGANPYVMSPNTGGVLSVNIGQVPQIAQYSALYQKYRIKRATFICIPTWNTMSADPNAQFPNPTPPPAVIDIGMSRLVYAINDSPGLAAPASEDVVLEDNGCKIICGKPKIKMSCRPVPNTQDANAVQMTFKNKFINFSTGGNPDIAHFGITWWHTQPGAGQPQGYGVPYYVYVKLTFQLADPR